MPLSYTPLRYPGGKGKLGAFLADVLRANRLIDATYAEPYAGGAGAAMYLLFRGYVRRVLLNDIDQGVVAFWEAVLSQNERFAREVERVPLTVSEWDRQRAALRQTSGFELGFAFFYVNRTTRSGIMNGGIIGGRRQNGRWRIDARFNRDTLRDRIRAIGRLARHVSICRADALDFLGETEGVSSPVFTYLDPPYFVKGQDLYKNFYCAADHETIAGYLAGYPKPWLATYDACEEVRKLYCDRVVVESEISYSAREVRRGEELVILGPGVRLPRVIEGVKGQRYRRGFQLLN